MTLAELWALLIGVGALLYVMLDGFDLGIGMLFGTTDDEDFRRTMMSAIAPVWDGNETWLIFVAASLFACFPMVYAILLPAFYLPAALLLVGLILRGVAFEFRDKTRRMRPVWDWGFSIGSLVATVVQGAAVGAMVNGLAIENGRFVGGAFDWLSPFAIACGIGLVIGYALIGAAWLVLKTEGALRAWAYQRLLPLAGLLFVFLVFALIYSLASSLAVMDRWLDRPWLLVFPAIGAVATVGLVLGVRRRIDGLPFAMSALIFLAAFGTMAGSFWPYLIPFSVTISEAASPPESLRFLFYGAGLFVMPVIFAYTLTVYWIFRGKVRPEEGYHH